MSTRVLLLYFVTWLLVALTPGPAVMCSMAQSTRHGFRASLAGISGIQSGNAVFFACIAGGLGTLLSTATTAFTILRTIGAVYLLYLGVRILARNFHEAEPVAPRSIVPTGEHHRLFLQGLLVQVANPKALLFVSALLPQFIDPRRPVPVQLALLMITTIAVDTAVLSSYAWLARRGVDSLRSSGFTAWLERALGAALVLFGVRLLAARK